VRRKSSIDLGFETFTIEGFEGLFINILRLQLQLLSLEYAELFLVFEK
jgi:hypothetical protein